MNNQEKIALTLVLTLLAGFAFGRYSAPEKVKTVTQTVEVEKKSIATKADEHKKTTIVSITKPDGSKQTTTVIADDTRTNTSETEQDYKKTDSTTEVTRGGSSLNIAALAGVDIFHPPYKIIYGASVSRRLLGPITLGLFGMTSGVGGVSFGILL